MSKPAKKTLAPKASVRTRRAYFDCRFGQLHVRTAFPATGGFDEGVTLFCLHAEQAASRAFGGLLPLLAADRSVYAPDLPGCGESDPAPRLDFEHAAQAVADLAADLRLRQIDLLGMGFGGGVALALAGANPALVRRLVVAAPTSAPPQATTAPCLVLRAKAGPRDDAQSAWGRLPRAEFVEVNSLAPDLFETAADTVIQPIRTFLGR